MKRIITIILLIMHFQWVNAIELTIKYRDGTSEIKYFDDDMEKLSITYGRGYNIVAIIGLEKFGNLRELWLGMTPYISDYNFLRNLNTIETLVFQDILISDIDFIYEMASLKRLIFQSCRIKEKIDASKLPNLEYFEFTHSSLTEFPIINLEKRNMEIINIAYNNISSIPLEETTDIIIIALRNPLDNFNYENVITVDTNIYFLLPEKYREYVR